MKRPDLSGLPQDVTSYIEFLELQLNAKHPQRVSSEVAEESVNFTELVPDEPPTRVTVITLSKKGFGKRSFRHLYSRQHRSGMGVFDLEFDPKDDIPVLLTSAEENATLLLFTNYGRAFRLPANRFEITDIRNKGTYVLDRLPLDLGEFPAALIPERASGYICMLSSRGRIRILRHHLFGEHMRPGTSFFNPTQMGDLVSACWTNGDADIFILTNKGLGIRFSEKVIPPQGEWAIHLGTDDQVVSVTSVYEDSKVFLLSRDGKGTLRNMSGFAANKSLGGNGKIALKCDQALAGIAINLEDDLFIISRLGKLIRFSPIELPETESPVQGVLCMSLRADEVVAMIQSGSKSDGSN